MGDDSIRGGNGIEHLIIAPPELLPDFGEQFAIFNIGEENYDKTTN